MSSRAYKEYYQRNREVIIGKMRERNKALREEKKREALKSPEALEAWREDNREKYYRARESKITNQLKTWLDDRCVSETFKKFLKECLWEHKGKLTKEFVSMLGELSIVDAFKLSQASSRVLEDGNTNQITEGEGEEEGSEEGSEGETD